MNEGYFIDIHTHILNNVDDGSKSLEESIDILREAERMGVTDIILTPHHYKTYFEESKDNIINKYNVLSEKAKQLEIDINLHLGNEIYVSPDISSKVFQEEILTLNNSRYVLVETSFDMEQLYLKAELKKLLQNGYIPILAHPERYRMFQNDIKKVDEYLDMGVQLQCNYYSIIGGYGKKAEKVIKKLLKSEKVTYLASDTHFPDSIYIEMPNIMEKLEKIVDDEYLEELTYINALNIINNK